MAPVAAMATATEPLIHVSLLKLILVTVPLGLVAVLSYYMGLQLQVPIGVGMIRTFVQLSILGYILQPIFERGREWWGLVVLYCIFMVCMASYESFARSKYYFDNMLL